MPTAVLTGSITDFPTSEVAAPVCARLELETGLERRSVTLATDSPVAVPFSTPDVSVVRIFVDPKLNTSTKVTARVTSADGTQQLVPVDPIAIIFSQSVPFTAIDLIRVAGQTTVVDLTLGQKAA